MGHLLVTNINGITRQPQNYLIIHKTTVYFDNNAPKRSSLLLLQIGNVIRLKIT